MPKNQNSLNSDLFALLQSRGYSPVLLDTSGKEVPVPDEAEVFQFNFVKNDEDYGTVTVSIDGLHKLVVYFDDKVADSPKERSDTGEENWYTLLKRLKNFARIHQLSFEIRNTDKLRYDMKQREHLKKLDESYHAVNKHKSYNDNVPETKIVIQHSKVMEEGEQRFRHVDKIFIENMLGERILAPTTKPGIAQVYARHLAEGGKPHDIRWQHIGAMVEEYSKMAGFVRATRGNQFNESAQRLVNEGLNHYQKLRECLSKMRGKRGYNTYFESWTPPLMEDEESVDLSEMFMQSSLDPRIESVMPILGKLSKNLGENKEMAEVIALENWADSIMTQEAKEEEADYGDEYQSDVLKLKQKAQAQEKKKPVDITALARRLKSVMDKNEKEVSEEQFGPAATAAIQQGRPPNEVHYADTGDKMNAEFHKIAMREQGVAEGFFGIDDKIKGKIQNIVSRLSDEYGMWDHKAQTFTPDGLAHLKSILKFNEKYIKYALSLTSRDFEAEGVAEGSSTDFAGRLVNQELVNRQEKYWNQVAKEKKDKEKAALRAAQSDYEKTPAGKAEKYWSQKGVAEGSEFGAYYYEKLAQQTFDINPNLTDENEILNLGYNIAKGELGSRAQGMFRDEDFPSDFVSAYGYLKKQGVAEGLKGTGNPGMPTPYDQGRNDAKKGRAYDNPYDQPGEEHEHIQYKKGYEQGKKQGVAEMDSQGYTGTRDQGDPYAKGSKATPVKAKDVVKQGVKVLNKAHPDYGKHEKKLISKMSNAEKVDKGWRNPNMEEGTYNKDVERAFPDGKARGVKTGASAPKGTSTMPKDKEKAKGKPVAEGQEDLEAILRIIKK